MLRIIKRAGVALWPKLSINLRSSRETKLVKDFLIHTVTAWPGNSPKVAMKHYLQVTDAGLAQAAGLDKKGAAKTAAARAGDNVRRRAEEIRKAL